MFLAALALLPALRTVIAHSQPRSWSGLDLFGGALLGLSAGANELTVSIIGLSLIVIAMVLMSTAAGRTPLFAALAVTILGAGFALVVTLTTNAVSQILPTDLAGGGVGIFQSAQFHGAGTGPALFGVLLSWRQSAPGGELNPLASTGAAAYSDVFLARAAMAVIEILPTLQLRRDRETPQ